MPGIGPLMFVATLGALCLIAGLVFMVRRPSRKLGWFAVPVLASELLVAASGFAPGRLSHVATNWVLGIFFWGLVAASAWWVFRARGHRPAAVALAVFGMSYAFFASFLAYMGFTGDWI
jgi:hypothetical protein